MYANQQAGVNLSDSMLTLGAMSTSSRPIPEAVSRLDNLAAQLEASFAGLEDQLSVVVAPCPPSDGKGELRALTAVPLAQLLHSVGDVLERVIARQASLAARLGI